MKFTIEFAAKDVGDLAHIVYCANTVAGVAGAHRSSKKRRELLGRFQKDSREWRRFLGAALLAAEVARKIRYCPLAEVKD